MGFPDRNPESSQAPQEMSTITPTEGLQWFSYGLSHKGSRVGSMVSNVAVLRGGGTFARCSLEEDGEVSQGADLQEWRMRNTCRGDVRWAPGRLCSEEERRLK